MTERKFHLDRTILICAEPETVFRYFTDSRRFADWWGAGSTIEGRPGGKIRIVFPNGITASGEVVEIVQDRKVIFTYGFDSGKPIPPGASLVTITLENTPEGTRVSLHHELPDEATRDEHIQGWRYQLALFANVAAREQHQQLAELVDDYFSLWSKADAGERRKILDRIAVPEIRFKDPFSCTSGLEDLNAHLTAVQFFMPGLTLVRTGTPRQCQDTAMADWIAKRADGTAAGTGTNVFRLTPRARIQDVVGFWSTPK